MSTPQGYSAATMADFVGHEFGQSQEIVVDQERINGFAEVTGDRQWIHIDVDKAQKHSPFGTTIAHGFLTLSLLAADVQNAGVIPADAKAVLNYGLGKVRFLTPVASGARVAASYKLAAVEDKGEGRTLATFEAVLTEKASGKPAVVAELLAMIIA